MKKNNMPRQLIVLDAALTLLLGLPFAFAKGAPATARKAPVELLMV